MSDIHHEAHSVLSLCRNEHCRVALSVLLEEDRTLTLNDLTRSIVGHTRSDPITEVSGDEVEQIYRDLRRVQLPRLAEDSLVQFDDQRGLVSPGGRLAEVQPQVHDAVAADSRLDAPLAL